MAADQGIVSAQANIGAMYANGEGVPKDDTEAAKWFRKAADQGHAKAQYNLGVMYYRGEGVLKNCIEAYIWLNLAAIAVEDGVKYRSMVERELTPEAIARAQQRSAELFNEIEARKKSAGK
jgi:hypothetical protein